MDLTRPYLVIPKLIKQPTWGGDYIATAKKWHLHPIISQHKIGQSYELFDKSNLSLLNDSQHPEFVGELTDNQEVETPTTVPNTVSLMQLISTNPQAILGEEVFKKYGDKMFLLIKFTQALGNSFQIHIKDGETHPKWKPKPESWYYFEPGLITLGIKSGIDWETYKKAAIELHSKILKIGESVKNHMLNFNEAKEHIQKLVKEYNLWQYVNLVSPQKDELIDLSACGIHHSWEEDTEKYPLGNVLYEIQLNLMDNESTIRSFDKGKMSKDGSTRSLQLEDYFELIDRSREANDPKTHSRKPVQKTNTQTLTCDSLLTTKYYHLDRVNLKQRGAECTEKITQFRHVFVKNGSVSVTSGNTTIQLTQGHSCFIPAGAHEYAIKNNEENSVVLISY